MPARLVWTLVLVCWIAGPFTGGQCLARCPAQTMAATSDDCHGATADTALTAAHDCGTHVAPVSDTARAEIRSTIFIDDVSTLQSPSPAPGRTVQTQLGAAPPELLPPISFLTPLRQ